MMQQMQQMLQMRQMGQAMKGGGKGKPAAN
jgi:hypothetical protein